MKLKEYLDLCSPGEELTCWDRDIDSEFYFYAKDIGEKPDKDFPNVAKCTEMLAEHLDIVKIHDGGVEVNLYELLENPKIVEFAKKNMFEEYQYEDDSDVVMMLFDDNVSNFSNGFEGFSELMVQCLNEVVGEGLDKGVEVEKDARPQMKYGDMITFMNNNGILLMQPVIADCVDCLLPIGWNGGPDEYEKLCEKCFEAYCDCGDTEIDVWDVVKETMEGMDLEKPDLDKVIGSCEKICKDSDARSEKAVTDREDR